MLAGIKLMFVAREPQLVWCVRSRSTSILDPPGEDVTEEGTEIGLAAGTRIARDLVASPASRSIAVLASTSRAKRAKKRSSLTVRPTYLR